MFRGVSGLGLEVWQPDFTGSPDSIYNSAHELVALQSFRTVLTTGGYNFLQPDLRFATDAHLHRKLYRHIIFSYQRKRLELESREAGGLAERNKMTNPNTYHIKTLAHRSDSATAFMRLCDQAMFRNAVAESGTRRFRRERDRVVPHTPEESQIAPRIPKKVTVDWIDPEYFNSLTVRTRAKFVKSKIALPLPEHITNWATLRQIDQMPYDQFMELFGNAVCSLYNFPSAEEIAQL
ncbi:hypothetical protein BD410DRAFT_685361, partial [Rickenella mellea]